MISRRGVLALGLGGALGSACGSSATSVEPVAAAPEVAPRVRTRWTARPDGPLPPAGDEGLPFRLALSGTEVAPVVGNGALRCALPDRHAAAYVMQTLPSPVRRIGAVFGFEAGSDAGWLALVAWVPGGLVTHCHVAVTPAEWIASISTGSGLDEIGRGSFDRLPQDGSARRVDVTFDGDRGVLDLPDGSRREVRDPRLAFIPGSVPGWEFYRHTAGGSPVVFHETWAG